MTTAEKDPTDWVKKVNDVLAEKRKKGLVHFHATFTEPSAEDLEDLEGLRQRRAKALYDVLTMSRWRVWVGRLRGELWMRSERFENFYDSLKLLLWKRAKVRFGRA
jgi:hypothetical protein